MSTNVSPPVWSGRCSKCQIMTDEFCQVFSRDMHNFGIRVSYVCAVCWTREALKRDPSLLTAVKLHG